MGDGWNNYSQLGHGTAPLLTSPVPVMGLGRADVVAAGATHNVAAGLRP